MQNSPDLSVPQRSKKTPQTPTTDTQEDEDEGLEEDLLAMLPVGESIASTGADGQEGVGVERCAGLPPYRPA